MITTVRGEASSLREKMIASGRYKPIDDDEYKRLQCEQSRKLLEQEAAQFKPDWSRIGILESESNLTWGAIKPGISDGYKGVEAVRPAYNNGHGIVFLWGNWGQAKTLLGKIVTATAFRDGKRAAYANMSTVLNDIRLAFDEKEYKTTELLRRLEWWCERDVLFLDELDKANNTQWAQEQIFTLLDKRYQMAVREQALTIIASNTSTNELDGYLKSRIHDNRVGVVVHLNGTDGRQFVPQEWKF
jgi:DNA replication protein DnaC